MEDSFTNTATIVQPELNKKPSKEEVKVRVADEIKSSTGKYGFNHTSVMSAVKRPRPQCGENDQDIIEEIIFHHPPIVNSLVHVKRPDI